MPATDNEPAAGDLRPDAFVSYRRLSDDTAFVDRLQETLSARGKRLWVDRTDIEPAELLAARARSAFGGAVAGSGGRAREGPAHRSAGRVHPGQPQGRDPERRSAAGSTPADRYTGGWRGLRPYSTSTRSPCGAGSASGQQRTGTGSRRRSAPGSSVRRCVRPAARRTSIGRWVRRAAGAAASCRGARSSSQARSPCTH